MNWKRTGIRFPEMDRVRWHKISAHILSCVEKRSLQSNWHPDSIPDFAHQHWECHGFKHGKIQSTADGNLLFLVLRHGGNSSLVLGWFRGFHLLEWRKQREELEWKNQFRFQWEWSSRPPSNTQFENGGSSMGDDWRQIFWNISVWRRWGFLHSFHWVDFRRRN